MIFLCPFQRQGRSDTFATEFDLEAEEYVPLPKGDVHKKKEIVQDVTLHDLDVANARPQVSAEKDHYFQHDLYCTCITDTSLNPGVIIFMSSWNIIIYNNNNQLTQPTNQKLFSNLKNVYKEQHKLK